MRKYTYSLSGFAFGKEMLSIKALCIPQSEISLHVGPAMGLTISLNKFWKVVPIQTNHVLFSAVIYMYEFVH